MGPLAKGTTMGDESGLLMAAVLKTGEMVVGEKAFWSSDRTYAYVSRDRGTTMLRIPGDEVECIYEDVDPDVSGGTALDQCEVCGATGAAHVAWLHEKRAGWVR